MHSISNHDCYRIVQQNHNHAKRFRSMHRDYCTTRLKRILGNTATRAAFLFALHLLEGMGT